MKSILDPTFKYVPAASTDIAATFKRVRREQAEQRKREQEQAAKVQPITLWRKA